METGEVVPQRSARPQNWTRRSLQRHLKVSVETIYKWEFEIHSNLLKLPNSFKIWQFLVMQSEGERKKHPPLDDYQVYCLILISELRKEAHLSDTIAQTVKGNEFKFYKLHEAYSKHHKHQKENNG